MSADPGNSDHFQVWVLRDAAEAGRYRDFVEGPDFERDAVKSSAAAENVLLLIMTSAGDAEMNRLLEAMRKVD